MIMARISKQTTSETIDTHCFSHLAAVEGENGPDALTARLRDVAFVHAVAAVLLTQISGNIFEEVLVGNGVA